MKSSMFKLCNFIISVDIKSILFFNKIKKKNKKINFQIQLLHTYI